MWGQFQRAMVFFLSLSWLQMSFYGILWCFDWPGSWLGSPYPHEVSLLCCSTFSEPEMRSWRWKNWSSCPSTPVPAIPSAFRNSLEYLSALAGQFLDISNLFQYISHYVQCLLHKSWKVDGVLDFDHVLTLKRGSFCESMVLELKLYVSLIGCLLLVLRLCNGCGCQGFLLSTELHIFWCFVESLWWSLVVFSILGRYIIWVFCEWPMMVASIFFLVMVNYLECFCKEQYIRLASIFSSVVLSFGMVL